MSAHIRSVGLAIAALFLLSAALTVRAQAQSGAIAAPAPSQATGAPASSATTVASAPQNGNGAARSGKSAKKTEKTKDDCAKQVFQGQPDYCKNPYWGPKDWDYINENNAGGL